ncbi:hypothetical protein [Protaetiibacter intestinalis]|uniref:Uncharacterized protein n=1 Tax=Protaetiibacter intestinalis TaxID=2419774 RepID=A0A387B1F7_9MICO|nr:hypothetical protein [Protaetiibacter intestinalis]AYF97354.1 hypothetical protein D7I47_03185 [Protaetiibacter intestinalis]
MTPTLLAAFRERLEAPRAGRRTRRTLAAGAVAASFALLASLALAPPAPPTEAAVLRAYAAANAQEVDVSAADAAAHLEASGAVTRDEYDATAGIETYKSGGTNHDWAKLVLLFAGFPQTDDSVTVMTRWMRQENGVDDWWNRNNPLNNGWGASAGAGGTGRNVNLVEAARNAADALHSIRGYAGIRAAFAAGAPAAEIEAAIWASPWASGHYANGAHWHYSPVKVVQAPASAWG